MIKLQDVSKVFYTDEVETHALSGIALEIRQGEFVSIGGPSGCGKSTLLSILGLLDVPTNGSYMLDGQPVVELTQAQRARIRNRSVGFIFQAFNLIGDLTVYENVELPLTYRAMPETESRLPVGSSAKMIDGLVTSARAQATRCCWPPDISLGRCLSRSRNPTVSITVSNQAWSGLAPARDSGSRMFSSAVSVGIRLKAWKMNPMSWPRSAVSSLSSNPPTSRPSKMRVPLVGLSSAPSSWSSVLLPEPLGPSMAMNSPC